MAQVDTSTEQSVRRPLHDLTRSPVRTDTTLAASLPESLRYRVKRVLLGPPLVSDQLQGQRLGKPTTLAVLSSDVMSSSAYASEEMLRILVPIAGLAAFSIITPMTAAILAVLAVVTICYRDVVKSYPKAGGSYVVSRDNFGPNIAQVAGATLLISYTITVAVSVAAGADAIISAAPSLGGYAVPMSIAFVLILAFGNLRGIREAGQVFAVPTYFFIANMAILIVYGLTREAMGDLPKATAGHGSIPLGHASGGLILGVSAFFLLRAFANGSSAMTGTEAISNGVSIFRVPQAKNARTTLVLMSTILGAMFLGVSVLAALTHSVPFVSGTPTVVSEIGKLVYGTSPAGRVLFYALQAATALILILAANTSFTGFPFLVSFVAEDSFLPRKLTVRGHRLVFSNGILLLAGASIVLLLATGAKVAALIPMYAIGVFTGFTMAGAGMVTHHWRHRDQHWRKGVAVNAVAAVVCAVVVVVFAIAEFTQGAWVVVIVMPLIVFALVRTNQEYREEDAVLEEGAAVAACEAKVLRRHVVVILVDKIDLATARAVQYARTLTPDDLHAVHFNIDDTHAELLISRWQQLGLARLPLDVIDCPDRRLGRAALELAAELTDGETEVSMLLPRRSYGKTWRRVLHDQTADRIVDVVSQLPHVNATIIPFHVAKGLTDTSLDVETFFGEPEVAVEPVRPTRDGPRHHEAQPISALQWRSRAKVSGRVKTVRVQPLSDVPTVQCVLVDGSGQAITLVFLGRQSISGLRSGSVLTAEGMVGKHHGKLAMINPAFELLSSSASTRTTDMTTSSDHKIVRALERTLPTWIWFAAVIVPIAVALLLVPSRGHLGPADDALVLVVVTVAVASMGNRGAAALAALVSAASFDFLLTRPYGSFRISRPGDITTEILFVAVGLLVGELAARGRQYQRAAVRGHLEISRLHDLGQRIAGGEEPEFVLIAVANELRELLNLQDCRFVREQPSGKGAWIDHDGTVRLNPLRWPTATAGLPTRQVELSLCGGGKILGTFLLTPTPVAPISHEQCLVTVALVDQLGAALAHEGN